MGNDSDHDRDSIAELIGQQGEAWNAGDATRFADAFQPDGCFVNVLGALTYGREPFEKQHAKIFATVYKNSRIQLHIRRIHFLRPDVAIVDIDAQLADYSHLPPGLKTEADNILRTRLQEVLTKESDEWTVASFHNVDVKPGHEPPGR